MGSPTRHGVDWGRVGPSPSSPAELDVGKKGGGGGGGGPFAPPPPSQILPVSVVDAFFQSVPPLSLQPIIKTLEGQVTLANYDPNNPDAADINPIQLAFYRVPKQYVYIIIDVFYYAVVPAGEADAPPVALTADQLTGIVRFDLTFGDRQPARFDVQAVSPYANPGTAATLRTGFPFVETQFGPRRTAGFAVYARSDQEVLVTVQFDAFPQFAITKFGAHMHGYGIPEAQFESVFERRRIG